MFAPGVVVTSWVQEGMSPSMAAAGSDFACASGDRAPLLGDERLCVGGALLATFSLGFVEACLHVERRPVPLRFALKFAAVNVAPSAVWSSVSARHVALSSGVPEASLILPNAWSAALPPAAAARRILALRTVRAFRLAVGSYGLAWSVWRAWGADPSAASGASAAPAPGEERVLRVAPVGSTLSRASKAKHGDHVTVAAAPRQPWQRGQAAVDWAALGLRGRGGACSEGGTLGGDRVALVEVEVTDAASAQHATQVVKTAKTRAEPRGPWRTVGVVSSQSPPPPLRELLDVCFNPLSVVLKALSGQCVRAGCDRVVLVHADDCGATEAATSRSRSPGVRVRAPDVAKGLLFQHGISSTTGSLHDLVGLRGRDAEDAVVVVVVAEKATSALAAAKELSENGCAEAHELFFIVNDSLVGKVESALAVALSATDDDDDDDGDGLVEGDAAEGGDPRHGARRWVSVADVCDAVLQEVREMLRDGMDAPAIQAAIYTAYGPQWVCDARPDRFSDVDKYI